MKGAIFVLFLLSNNWNFFQKTSNITTNIYLYINISNITTNIYLSLCDQDSAMPKSNSNLHHSIECAQIDNSTLLKIENWWLLRVDIPRWSHGSRAILRRWRWGGWKSANFAGRFLYRHDVLGKSGDCYWKNRRWGATLVFEIIFPTNFVAYS